MAFLLWGELFHISRQTVLWREKKVTVHQLPGLCRIRQDQLAQLAPALYMLFKGMA